MRSSLNLLVGEKKDGGTVFVALLRACAKNNDLVRGTKLHDDIIRRGLLERCTDSLVTMYAKCGALAKAKELFDAHQSRDLFTWTAIIAGHAQKGQGEDAIKYYEQMLHEGLSPDAVTFTCILKACGSIGAPDKGEAIHHQIAKQGLLGSNILLGNALVDMYAKCGDLAKSSQVLEELPLRNVISWTTLITHYVQSGDGLQALNCFEKMQQEGLSPDAITFSCLLKACGSTGSLGKGGEIHEEIAKQGLLCNDLVLGTALVDMYAKCGDLTKARRVLEELPARNVISWSALISAYAERCQGKEVLECYEQMCREGISPDELVFICVLKACGLIGAADVGEKVHDEIAKQRLLEKSVVLANSLVDFYAKCGAIAKAQRVLEELPSQNVTSWNALIGGYVGQCQGGEALNCYVEMQCKGVSPDSVTFMVALRACGSIRAVEKGREIHDEISKQGLLRHDFVLGTSLVDMYAKCGALAKARTVLEDLPIRDAISWNALIAGHAEQGEFHQVLDCFEEMQQEGLSPDSLTFSYILRACGSIGAFDRGEQIYDEIATKGLLEDNVPLGTALVEMYVNCGALENAQRVLWELPARDVVTWNTLLAGYVEQGKHEQALKCLEEMQGDGLSPDGVTFSYILKACARGRVTGEGERVHDEIAKQGLLGKHVVLGNALVDMYAKCGALAKARQVHEEFPIRNVISWSALIGGYVEHSQGEQALNCFGQMQGEGLAPDAVTFICILKACGSTGAVDKGEEIHEEIAKQGLLANNILLGTALVDMYATCGAMTKAQQVLDRLPARDVIAWNALLTGYAQQCNGAQVLNCFEQMLCEGLCPDSATFSSVLSGCTRMGLVDNAGSIFVNMSTRYGMMPDLEHCTCLVDLFGRVGHLDKAMGVIEKLPVSNRVVWSALLGACRKWGDVHIGKWAFEQAIQVDKHDSALYVLMADIYAAAGMKKDAENIEAMRVQNKAWDKQSTNLQKLVHL